MRVYVFILLFFSFLLHAQNQLKILFVVGLFPKRSETFILNQITSLIDRGHDVWIHSYCYGKKNELCSTIKKYNLLKKTSYGEWCPYDLKQFDILYCQFGMMGNKMLRQKQKVGSNAKLVTCFRGYDITQQLKKYPHTYDTLLKQGDLFLPVCDYFATILYRLGVDPQKVFTHHSAIDCKMFSMCQKKKSFETDSFHLVSISRLVDKKGIDDAIHAFAYVVKKYPKAHYTIVGDGYLRKKLESLAKALGISKNITFKGSVPHKQIPLLLATADCVILPSKKAKNGNQEGIPNVLKEAMACGVSVISTYHSGIPELIENGSTGLLVKEQDVASLAKAIILLIKNPAMRERMGILGREKVIQAFEITTLVDRLEGYFYDLYSRNDVK